MVMGNMRIFTTRVNRIMDRPIFRTPKELVNRNSASIIHPNTWEMGPINMPSTFVKTK